MTPTEARKAAVEAIETAINDTTHGLAISTRRAASVAVDTILSRPPAVLQGLGLPVDALRERIAELEDANAELSAWVRRLQLVCPDDIRSEGWAVAVHNDYRLNGKRHTFWLFTQGDRCLKGEGETDADALDQIRDKLVADMVAPFNKGAGS